MKVSRWTLLWLLIVGGLIAIWIGTLTGQFSPANLATSILGVLFALLVIAILAIVGAVFMGMWVSHRILSSQGFTPFEQEMLKMRQEVRDLRERMEVIASKLGLPSEPRTKGP